MTQRRTAKLSEKTARSYVAIHCDFIPAQTTMIRCTALEAKRFEGINDCAVDIKAGEVFYLHRAASLGPDMFYVVRCEVSGAKKCSCASSRPCRHENAVAARETARRIAKAKATTPRRQVEDWGDEAKPAPKPDLAERGTLTRRPASFAELAFAGSPEMQKRYAERAGLRCPTAL